MVVTAKYGQGVYGQSRYGVLTMDATSTISFTGTASAKLAIPINGTSTVTFSLDSHLDLFMYMQGTSSIQHNIEKANLVRSPYHYPLGSLYELFPITSENSDTLYYQDSSQVMDLYYVDQEA